MKILLPVDGSPYTQRMLAQIGQNAELLGKQHEYTALTVVTPIPPHATRYLGSASLNDYYAEQAEAVLAPLREQATQNGWRLQTAHAVGSAADQIADYAASHPTDLLVMGTHGHGALGNMVLGSVTTGVIARVKVPVLLVR
ncbi:universal stress protein [Aquabacterium sp. J223]|uniref:universal stress protein n=1 Tax=Aquabacterium sp. J223 TaxID=2898431 RepID=UPI0021AE1E6A|nr:universal stress protein [Aquabacterium sp. J223]UUX97402.1 universal stress protein [Aquabacterium sp. J223]